jgi:hypothetical protein
MSHGEQKKLLIKRMRQVAIPQGVQGAINATGRFIGNVSEAIAENPVATNAIEEIRIPCRKL